MKTGVELDRTESKQRTEGMKNEKRRLPVDKPCSRRFSSFFLPSLLPFSVSSSKCILTNRMILSLSLSVLHLQDLFTRKFIRKAKINFNVGTNHQCFLQIFFGLRNNNYQTNSIFISQSAHINNVVLIWIKKTKNELIHR